MSRSLEDLTGPEIADAISPDSILLLPVGAVEQHGPHLPLSVDHVIAHESATAVTNQCGEAFDVWQLPTLSISKSNEHAWSPGTMWLSVETMLAVLCDIGRCVAATGANRLVLLNAHGGNTTTMATALREIRLRFDLKTFLVHPLLPADHGGVSSEDELGMGIHGGLDETSIFMHLRPDEVQLEKAERRIPEALANNRHVKFGGSVSFGWTSQDFFDDGYIGDPRDASAELGKTLFEASVTSLCEAMAEVKAFDFGR